MTEKANDDLRELKTHPRRRANEPRICEYGGTNTAERKEIAMLAVVRFYKDDDELPLTDPSGRVVYTGDCGFIGKDYQFEETVDVSPEV